MTHPDIIRRLVARFQDVDAATKADVLEAIVLASDGFWLVPAEGQQGFVTINALAIPGQGADVAAAATDWFCMAAAFVADCDALDAERGAA